MKCSLFRNFSHIAAFIYLFLFAAISTYSAEPDTVKVTSKGEYNQVIVNYHSLDASFCDTVDAPVQGEIIQTGKNNRVEIYTNAITRTTNTKSQMTNNKSKVTGDSCLKTRSKLQKTEHIKKKAKPAGPHIKVTQTGTNNRVKINAQKQ